jgi:hypothetical protein
MSRKKISTTIYVTPEQSERLRLLHERTKVPVAVYIREGIDLVLREYVHLLPGQLPLDVEPPSVPAAGRGTELSAALVAAGEASIPTDARLAQARAGELLQGDPLPTDNRTRLAEYEGALDGGRPEPTAVGGKG